MEATITFSDLGLSPEVLRALEEAGYTTPTPIQQQAIPVILMGRDVLGVAQTGTGKTAGFTLPMIEILAGSRAKARMPRSLILAPTRELAAQVAENFEKYGKYHRLTMARLIGGENISPQEKLLDRGVDVLIATPGRMLDLFQRGRILLNDVKVLVIDEADRMLDMGFIPDIEKIVSFLPKIRQTLFFSATMAPEIRRLADAFLMNPKEISVAPQASAASTVSQFLVVCNEIDKREALRHLLRTENVRNAFIFCNRKSSVDTLFRSLAKHDFDVAPLHGDMAQSARTETMERFRRGEIRLVACSDVAARGIDISDLSHVFNFDVPHHAEDYIHRIGRTGRAGKEGRAFTLATPDDAKFLSDIVKLIGTEIPKISVEGLPDLELGSTDGPRGGRRARSPAKAAGEGRAKSASPRTRAPRAGSRAAAPETAVEVEIAPEMGQTADIAVPEPEAPKPTARASRSSSTAARQKAERPAPAERQAPAERSPERAPAPRDSGRDRKSSGRGRQFDDELEPMRDVDGVIGFGSFVPDFIKQTVPLPVPGNKAADDEGDAAPAENAEQTDGETA